MNTTQCNLSLGGCCSMCHSCEQQQQRCRSCNIPITTNTPNKICPQAPCCQDLLQHSLMHILQNFRLMPCACVCQHRKNETNAVQKPNKRSCKDKCNQTCLQYDEDIPERDNSPKRSQKEKKCKKTKQREANKFSFDERQGDKSEEDSDSDERTFGFYGGEGDKRKSPSFQNAEDISNYARKVNRHPLAYFVPF